QREYLCSAGRRNPETGENPTCPSFGIVQGKPTTRVKADRIDALGLGFLLGLVRAPDKLKRIQADRDRQRAALDVDADRDAVENRIAQLDRRRAFLVNQAATDAEVGRLDRDAYNLALGSVDEDLDAARAELSRLDADAEEAAKVRMSIEEILGMVSNLSDEALAKMDGYTPDGPGRNAPERLTVGWVWMLQNEVAEALTPGMRGATSPLSKWAIEETRWLVERLGCFMVLSRNDGDGPRLIDRETGDNVAVGLAEKLKGQNPARWPDASIGIDVTLSTQRAALRGESAQVRHAINQQRPRQ
ncbi:MAG: hypothetical protein M3112_02370, partial [Actinomycetia bacterium]|nr:hypothetical protein [Actinomycetes bacterium]